MININIKPLIDRIDNIDNKYYAYYYDSIRLCQLVKNIGFSFDEFDNLLKNNFNAIVYEGCLYFKNKEDAIKANEWYKSMEVLKKLGD